MAKVAVMYDFYVTNGSSTMPMLDYLPYLVLIGWDFCLFADMRTMDRRYFMAGKSVQSWTTSRSVPPRDRFPS